MSALTVVLDFGKTMTKATLWSSDAKLLSRVTRENERVRTGGRITLDVAGIDAWLGPVLADFATFGEIGSIIPVGHGAAAAVVRKGQIVAAPLDYEERLDDIEDYRRIRAPFAETGSPCLPEGLNLGAQLFHLERHNPAIFDDDAQILTWPQFWAWRLCDVTAAEVTSLGCHTDLWNPVTGEPSRLARDQGWADRLPPLAGAGDVLGTVTLEWMQRSGLSATTRVFCGLHDSNAALIAARGFAEIADGDSTVLSTGTWFVAMRTPTAGAAMGPANMPELRDCLVNVDALGQAIPSARFMGGREIEILTGLDTRRIDIKPDQPALVAAVDAVLAKGARILPTFAPGFGPFSQGRGRWIAMPVDQAERRAAVSLYAALVACESLELIGTRNRVLVEGRFAEAEVFIRALAALRPELTVFRSHAHNDVSFGALRVLDPSLRPASVLEPIAPLAGDILSYQSLWREDINRQEVAA